MQVFVTGATGYIGAVVAETLQRAGHSVLALARTAEKAAALAAAGYAPHRGSLADLDSLRAGARAADAVIHAAIDWGPHTARLDAAAVDAMLDAAAGTGKVFVYTSGVWVIGETGDRMLGEVCPVNPPPLVAWRPPLEERVLGLEERGARGVVLRVGSVYGCGGGFLGRFFAQARAEGCVRIVGDGENYWSIVHVEDLADLYLCALTAWPRSELYIAASGMPQKVKKLAQAVAKACGCEGRVEHWNVAAARKTLGAMADCQALSIKAGSTKAARYLGWTPHRPNVYAEIEHGSYL